MKLNEFKVALATKSKLTFQLPNGETVPSHFHVTEVGKIQKTFIDCGGTKRVEERINFQLWTADDVDHSLHPDKLMKIVELAEKELDLSNEEIEVEYQSSTIGKYGLEDGGEFFQLVATLTDCLAKDKCGIPEEKIRVNIADLNANSCAPGSGCC